MHTSILTFRLINIFHNILFEYKLYNQEIWPTADEKIWSLWKTYPAELIVLNSQMSRPNNFEFPLLYNGYFDWRYMYNLNMQKQHLQKYIDYYCNIKFDNLTDIDCLPNTFGEMSRYIFYGDWQPC